MKLIFVGLFLSCVAFGALVQQENGDLQQNGGFAVQGTLKPKIGIQFADGSCLGSSYPELYEPETWWVAKEIVDKDVIRIVGRGFALEDTRYHCTYSNMTGTLYSCPDEPAIVVSTSVLECPPVHIAKDNDVRVQLWRGAVLIPYGGDENMDFFFARGRFRRCADHLAENPAATDGYYWLHGVTANEPRVRVFCNMTFPGYTLVSHFYEVADQNDFPDEPEELIGPWVQTGAGSWKWSVDYDDALIDAGYAWSLGEGLVARMERWGASNLRICFFSSDFSEDPINCRETLDGSLGMDSIATPGNMLMDKYAYNPLLFTWAWFCGVPYGTDVWAYLPEYHGDLNIYSRPQEGSSQPWGSGTTFYVYVQSSWKCVWHQGGGGAVFQPQWPTYTSYNQELNQLANTIGFNVYTA